MLRGTLDGPTTARVCDENLTTQRNLYHSAVPGRCRFGQKLLASCAYSRLCSLVPYKKLRVILLNLVAKC